MNGPYPISNPSLPSIPDLEKSKTQADLPSSMRRVSETALENLSQIRKSETVATEYRFSKKQEENLSDLVKDILLPKDPALDEIFDLKKLLSPSTLLSFFAFNREGHVIEGKVQFQHMDQKLEPDYGVIFDHPDLKRAIVIDNAHKMLQDKELMQKLDKNASPEMKKALNAEKHVVSASELRNFIKLYLTWYNQQMVRREQKKPAKIVKEKERETYPQPRESPYKHTVINEPKEVQKEPEKGKRKEEIVHSILVEELAIEKASIQAEQQQTRLKEIRKQERIEQGRDLEKDEQEKTELSKEQLKQDDKKTK